MHTHMSMITYRYYRVYLTIGCIPVVFHLTAPGTWYQGYQVPGPGVYLVPGYLVPGTAVPGFQLPGTRYRYRYTTSFYNLFM